MTRYEEAEICRRDRGASRHRKVPALLSCLAQEHHKAHDDACAVMSEGTDLQPRGGPEVQQQPARCHVSAARRMVQHRAAPEMNTRARRWVAGWGVLLHSCDALPAIRPSWPCDSTAPCTSRRPSLTSFAPCPTGVRCSLGILHVGAGLGVEQQPHHHSVLVPHVRIVQSGRTVCVARIQVRPVEAQALG